VFYRERIDGLYGTTTFMLSYMSIEIPLDVRQASTMPLCVCVSYVCRVCVVCRVVCVCHVCWLLC
jgi:hypothetical protein